jgi:hypothetical protein
MSFTFNTFWLLILVMIGGAFYALNRRGRLTLPKGSLPLFLGLFFVGVGLLLLFVVAPQNSAVASHAQSVPHRIGIVVDMSAGDEVMLTGIIQPGTGIADSDSRIRSIVESNQLVAYEVDRWIVEYDDNSGYYKGRWTFDHRHLSGFTVESEGYSFKVLPADIILRNTSTIDLYRQPQEMIPPAFDCDSDCTSGKRYREAHYNGQILTEGSLRVSGYRPGDTVTVMGTLVERGVLRPIHISGGTRDNLLDSLHAQTTSTQIGGVMGVVIGLIFAAYGYSQMPGARKDSEHLSAAELTHRSR